MTKLIAICYDDRFQAEEVRTKFLRMQKDYLIDLEDAVVAWKNKKGKVKLSQVHDLTGAGALSGGFWGMLIGLIFMNPLFGAAIGATWGAVGGALADIGISNDMMKDIASKMDSGNSVLFVLARQATPDKVLAELQGTGGTLLQSNLTHENEQKLQAALDATGKEAAATSN